MNGNITTAPLGGNRNIKTKPLFQYDYGQVLKIVGVTLPAAYEVHFSNQLHGVATTQIGNADGVVIIPDIYLTTGLPVYVWLYLHTGESDGETEYTITIPVIQRASISDQEPTPVQQDVITQAIAALNTAVEQTAQDVQDATEAKQDAEEAAGEAYESAVTAGQYATTAGGHAADAAEASHNAEYQAGRAEQAHLDAQAAQWAAESAQTAAEAAQAGAVAARTGAETAQAGAVAARDEIRNMHATANTLPAGSQATASYSDGTLTLGIPKGDKGDQGQKGDTGDRGEQGEKGEKGDTGATGATPDFEIGTVQTLPAGSSATATITGTLDNPLLNLGIPKGDKGDTGEVTQVELSALSTGLTSDLDLVQTSGTIVETEDAFPTFAEDVTAEIVPVQDLHGYSNPWPGGGGENILDPNIKFTTQTVRGVTLTTTDGYNFRVSGTGESGAGNLQTNTIPLADCIVYPAGTYTVTGMIIGTYHTDGSWYSNRGGTFTSPEDFVIRNGYREIATGTTYNTNDFISMDKGTTALAAWSPYENLCPISGFDSVKVTRTRKNLLNPDGSYFAVGREYQYGSGAVSVMRNADGSYHIWTNGNSVRVDLPIYTASTNTGIVVPTGDYTFTIYGNEDVSSIVHLCGSGVGDGLNGMAYFDVTKTATRTCLDGNAPLSYLFFRIFAGESFDVTVRIQMEVGTDSTAYEPYHGIQVELPFGKTVYGGTIDLTTGKLTVDRAMVDLGSLAYWSKDPNRPGVFYTSASAATRKTRGFCACSEYKWRNDGVPSPGNLSSADNTISLYPSYGAGYIFVVDIAKAELTGEQFLTAMNGVQLVYELATPETYDLTPAQVLLLRDYNVLWANTGDIINLEYRAGSFVPKKTYDALKEATLIHSTASGAIASFSDGAEMPVDEVTVQINPVQDLHGYDHPWPGGGGSNIWDEEWENGTFNTTTGENINTVSTNRQIRSKNSRIPVKGGESYYFKWINNSEGYGMWTMFFDADGNIITGFVPSGNYVDRSGNCCLFHNRVVEVPENAAFCKFYCTIDYGDTYNHDLAINYPSTVTNYTPHTNICPISGFNGLTVTRTGKNLLDDTGIELTGTALRYARNSGHGTAVTLKKGYTYTVSVNTSTPATAVYIVEAYSGTQVTSRNTSTYCAYTATEDKQVGFDIYWANGRPAEATHIMLELGSTATAYEPYTGQTYDIAFPSESGTVYGGSLTIAEDGSGVLTVDRASVDLGTLNYFYVSSGGVNAFRSNINALPVTDNSQHGITSIYPFAGTRFTANMPDPSWMIDSQGRLFIRDDRYTDVSSLKTYLSGQNLVFELATPITYSLTASQITTLLGENNLWHDANGDISVGYKANTKLYIDGKIAELVAQIVNS